MKEQLVDTLYDVQMAAADKTSKTGNIIVMGGKECGKDQTDLRPDSGNL